MPLSNGAMTRDEYYGALLWSGDDADLDDQKTDGFRPLSGLDLVLRKTKKFFLDRRMTADNVVFRKDDEDFSLRAHDIGSEYVFLRYALRPGIGRHAIHIVQKQGDMYTDTGVPRDGFRARRWTRRAIRLWQFDAKRCNIVNLNVHELSAACRQMFGRTPEEMDKVKDGVMVAFECGHFTAYNSLQGFYILVQYPSAQSARGHASISVIKELEQ